MCNSHQSHRLFFAETRNGVITTCHYCIIPLLLHGCSCWYVSQLSCHTFTSAWQGEFTYLASDKCVSVPSQPDVSRLLRYGHYQPSSPKAFRGTVGEGKNRAYNQQSRHIKMALICGIFQPCVLVMRLIDSLRPCTESDWWHRKKRSVLLEKVTTMCWQPSAFQLCLFI